MLSHWTLDGLNFTKVCLLSCLDLVPIWCGYSPMFWLYSLTRTARHSTGPTPRPPPPSPHHRPEDDAHYNRGHKRVSFEDTDDPFDRSLAGRDDAGTV